MEHKHSELIKAWAGGAIIQFKFGDTYRSFKQNKVDWASCSNDTLRIKPDCQYAIDKLTHDFSIDDIQGENTELTIRDKFAMSALNGLFSYQAGQCTKVDAEFAYNQADAMLEARK